MTSHANYELLLDHGEDRAAVLNPAEFKRLLREAGYGRNRVRNVAIVWMLFGSALRVTEIANLKVKDVLGSDGLLLESIHLPSAYTKNGESRLAYIFEPEHRQALMDYLNWRTEKRLRVTDSSDYLRQQPNSPLFLARGASGFAFLKKEHTKVNGETAEYWVCSSLQQLLTDMIKRIGVPGGSSHSGRRTFATRLADRGVEMNVIQYLLGHKQPQQTLAYIESRPNRLRGLLKGVYGSI